MIRKEKNDMLVARCNKKIFEIYFLINYMIIKKTFTRKK
jgi:hypothetical protein